MESMGKKERTTPLVRMAVPKKGRLYNDIVKLINGSGLKYTRQSRLDIAYCKDFPLQLVFLPAKDIATFVGQGDIDLGITGMDIIAEAEMTEKVTELLKLNIGHCKIALQAPVGKFSSLSELRGKRICTSFPNITNAVFGDVNTSVRYISGSVEAACGLGLADAVVDLVETGTTMRAAGLEVVEYLMDTETVLIRNAHEKSAEVEKVIQTIVGRFTGVLAAIAYKMMYYNIPKEKFDQAKVICPGRKAPTVTPVALLDGAEWLSVGCMVKVNDVDSVMDQLKAIGATDIFVVMLDNCRLD